MSLLGSLVAYAESRGVNGNVESKDITYELTIGRQGFVSLKYVGEPRRVPRVLKDRSSGVEPRPFYDTVKYTLMPGTIGDPARHFTAFWDMVENSAPPLVVEAVRAFRADTSWTSRVSEIVAELQKEHKDLTFDDKENVIIAVQGLEGYLHELPEAKPQAELLDVETECVVSGERCRPVRLHPSVEGVPNTQKGRVPLVSYNAPVYEFEGRSQGSNCPVSLHVATSYTAALSDMLLRVEGGNHRRRKSAIILPDDRALLLWADSPNIDVGPILDVLLTYPSKEDKDAPAKAWTAFDALLPSDELVHILVLEGDSGRISITRSEVRTFSEILENLRQFREDFYSATEAPSLFILLLDLEPPQGEMSVVLKSQVYEAVLLGDLFPRALEPLAIRSVVTMNQSLDQDQSWYRSAATRVAWTQSYRRRRNMPHHNPPTTPAAVINLSDYIPENASPAFHEGRWLAMVERIQITYSWAKHNKTSNDPIGKIYLSEFATNTRRTKSVISTRLIPMYRYIGDRHKWFKALEEIEEKLLLHETPRRANRNQEEDIGRGYYAQKLYLRHLLDAERTEEDEKRKKNIEEGGYDDESTAAQ